MRHLPSPSRRPSATAGRALALRGDPGRPAADRSRSDAERLPSLTGLRFTAAGGVVYTHTALLMNPDLSRTLGPEVWVGSSAVSLFFILSGYVLTHSARRGDTARAFWRRRAAKILPNHVLTWCVVTAALFFTGSAVAASASGIAATVSSLLLVNTWVPSRRFVSAGNPVSWSLAAEMFFYLLFPALRTRVERLSRRGLLICGATAVAVVWSWPLLCTYLVASDASVYPGYWLLYVMPVARLPEFVLGMVAARMSSIGLLPRIGALPAGLSVLGAVIVGSRYLPHAFMYAAATAVPLVVLVHATAELDRRGKVSFLRTPPAVFLGEISYALYLVHLLVLGVVYLDMTAQGRNGIVMVLVALPLALLASWLLYVRVEQPCVRRFSAPRARTAKGGPPARDVRA